MTTNDVWFGNPVPNILELAVLVETTMPASYVAGLPIVVQRLLFGMLGRLGRLAGNKPSYPELGLITPDGLKMPE